MMLVSCYCNPSQQLEPELIARSPGKAEDEECPPIFVRIAKSRLCMNKPSLLWQHTREVTY